MVGNVYQRRKRSRGWTEGRGMEWQRAITSDSLMHLDALQRMRVSYQDPMV
jgi:hypothetical protein